MNEQAAPSTADGSFGSLYADHRQHLFRLAVLLVGDRHVADEVVAEVFARVLPKWRAGTVSDPLPYLRRALVNEVRSRHRRRRSERAALERVHRSTGSAAPESPSQIDVELFEALVALPLKQRAVVVLRFHDDLSEAEVASTLGIAVGTVKVHTSRGLAALRQRLEESR